MRLLTCFFVLTVALTQPMSNQAAALVVLPIAMQTGIQLGVDPRAFGMMVAVAASCSYLTPLEPSCLMVYGPGKYQFFDFFKVGHAAYGADLRLGHRARSLGLADLKRPSGRARSGHRGRAARDLRHHVEEGERRSTQQHLHVARLLVVAVE